MFFKLSLKPICLHRFAKKNLPDEKEEEANVVGTLCENNDWFAKNRMLPKAEVGDLFVIHDTGAHSHSMGFQYNGKLRAPEVLIRPDGKWTAAFNATFVTRLTLETNRSLLFDP